MNISPIKKCINHFAEYGEESSRKTFNGELNYQAGKIFFLVFFGLVVWLTYIPSDLQMHQFPMLVVSLRVGFSLVSALGVILRFTKPFRHNPKAVLSAVVTYLFLATSVITATSGECISAYIGGFVFVIMLPIFAPFNLKFKIVNIILAVVTFFVLAFFAGVDFLCPSIMYSTTDMVVVTIVSIVFSVGQNALKRSAWKQRLELSQANEENQALTRHIQSLLKEESRKANYDALTEIYNRRFFDENLSQIISSLSRSKSAFSLMMIDIDYFKKYNDRYGHDEGDNCLKLVAKTLEKSVMRTEDFVARYGGEEFVVVLPHTDADGAQTVAEKMLENVRNLKIPHENSDVAEHVTISIGVVTGNVTHKQTGSVYVKQADMLLYESKQVGRDRYTASVI